MLNRCSQVVMFIRQSVKKAADCLHLAVSIKPVFSTFFDVNLADHLENRLLADFLSRKRSKALIYKGSSCYDLNRDVVQQGCLFFGAEIPKLRKHNSGTMQDACPGICAAKRVLGEESWDTLESLTLYTLQSGQSGRRDGLQRSIT